MVEFDNNPVIVQKAHYIENNVDVTEELFNVSLDKNVFNNCRGSVEYFFTSDGNLIIESKNENCNCIYLYFEVFSKRRCKILLSTKSFILCKYWNNGNFVGMGKQYYTTELDEGLNVFVVQHFYGYGQKYNYSCRISPLSFELENEVDGLIAENYSFDRNMAYLSHTDSYSVNGEQYSFMLLPNDNILVNRNQEIRYIIRDFYSKIIKKEGKISFYEKETINTSDYTCDNDSLDFLELTLEYVNGFNEKCCIREKILIQSIKKYPRIKSKIKEIISSKEINGYDRFVLEYFHDNIENADEDKFTYDAFDAIVKVENGISLYDELKNDGNHYILYKSKLDGAYRKIYIYVSSRGDTKNQYPLILNFLYNTNGNCCHQLSNYDKRFIAADVQSLGFTSGSYMGEACISEVIEILKSYFSIDNKRVFATGYSNGATALWAYAIYHPESFSAIYLLSGYVNCDFLSNIINKRIVNTSSDNDVMKKSAFDKPTEFLRRSKEYHTRIIQQINHSDLLKMQYKKKVLDWMFSSELDNFPREIYFTTNHMIHNKSYWITINGIRYSEKEASILAKVVENTIKIQTVNVTSLTIEIPPYIDKKNIRILINDSYVNSDSINDKLFFSVDPEISGLAEPKTSSPIYKGLGLLYPYMRPLKVYLPKEYTNNMLNVAEAFASPKTNGIDSKIMIKYPIVFVRENNDMDNSWIVINQNKSDSFIDSFKEKCKIKTDQNGYYYKNKYRKCKYCIFQIVDNQNKDCILYVNSNDDDLLKRCMFTRRVIISAYFNGYNPYWNNAALIYDGKEYRKIYEFGMDEEIV